MNKKKDLIMEYIDEEECICICKIGLYKCETCNHLEECYTKAKVKHLQTKCGNNLNYKFAKSINYGGYTTAEEFWNELLE